MVSKIISVSERVNDLSLFGRLLYTWMIPHADDWGRLPGSPAKVKVLVMPFADESREQFAEALADMSRKGLIIWYESSGDKFIQILKFEEHQQGLHKRTKSKLPPPPDDSGNIHPKKETSCTCEETPGNAQDVSELPGNSGEILNVPPELNRTEQKGTEQKGIEQDLLSGEDSPDPVQAVPPAPYVRIVEHFNTQAKTGYKPDSKEVRNLIKSLWKSGYTYEDFVLVINAKAKEWLTDPKMIEYLRPSTIFRPSNFSSYLEHAKRQLRGDIPAPDKPPPRSGNGGRRGNQKPTLPTITNVPTKTVTPEEFDEMWRRAERMDGSL
jgi:uncharacterized phage protein (TIGR02220 family)